MDNSKNMIERALRENHPDQSGDGLFEAEIEQKVKELCHYCSYLDEVSRQRLLFALEYGRIDTHEFKRRALNNDPLGVSRAYCS